jgi:hypothetical protein
VRRCRAYLLLYVALVAYGAALLRVSAVAAPGPRLVVILPDGTEAEADFVDYDIAGRVIRVRNEQRFADGFED